MGVATPHAGCLCLALIQSGRLLSSSQSLLVAHFSRNRAAFPGRLLFVFYALSTFLGGGGHCFSLIGLNVIYLLLTPGGLYALQLVFQLRFCVLTLNVVCSGPRGFHFSVLSCFLFMVSFTRNSPLFTADGSAST
jgi:hypothetical protein